MKLKDRVVLVTGGGSGIGRALCRAFASSGALVVAADIDAEGLKGTLEDLRGEGLDGLAMDLDVTAEASWQSLREQLLQKVGFVDVLCNNAGVLRVGPFVGSDFSDWQLQSRVNIDGVILGCKTFAPDMVAAGQGHIINTASLSGMLAAPDASTYTASKFAVVGFSNCLRYELAAKGVEVSVLCPGAIDTPMNHGVEFPAEDRLIEPAEVAERVVHAVRLGGKPYIYTHPEFRGMVAQQLGEILDEYDAAFDMGRAS